VRGVIAAFAYLAMFGCLTLITVVSACAVLGPAERTEIALTAATLERCQEIGRACKADGGTNCFEQYDSCVTDAGLR